jgi:hypothetical protein
LRRDVQLLDRIGLFLGFLGHLELGRLRDRHCDLVLARQLRLLGRLLHLIAAATASPSRAGFAQPDDLGVGRVGKQRLRHGAFGGIPDDEDDCRDGADVPQKGRDERRAEALLLLLE